MFDIVIVGCGPAGMSAAINAAARNKSALIVGRHYSSSMLYKAEGVDNYLGFFNISGKELMDRFYNHVISLGVKFHEGRVLQILPMGSYFTLNVDNNFIESRCVIIATGAAKGSFIKGEKEYLGKGVSYCATCDGMLFRNKKVVVCSENNEGEEDARFLSEICNKVYYVPKYKMNTTLNNVEIMSSKPIEIVGDSYVTGIVLGDKAIDCDGVFMLKNITPVDNLIPGLLINDEGSISVNSNMETNIKGVFAAGDCTGKPYQISKAAGEGLIASQRASYFIDSNL